MKVGLIGFGKTGKAVANVLLTSKTSNLRWVIRQSNLLEHRSVPEFLGIESDEPGLIYSKNEFTCKELLEKSPVDVIIDFSSQTGVYYYAEAAAATGVKIISAVSHYDEKKFTKLKELSTKTAVVWSPNITIGINFLLLAAKTLKNISPNSDIQIIEEHFKAKTEVSGTAVRIADELALSVEEVKSIRAGGIIGNHELIFGYPFQTVRLRHESISREAFGNGALFAAERILNHSVGMHHMEELLLPYFMDANGDGSVERHKTGGIKNLIASRLRKIAITLEN